MHFFTRVNRHRRGTQGGLEISTQIKFHLRSFYATVFWGKETTDVSLYDSQMVLWGKLVTLFGSWEVAMMIYLLWYTMTWPPPKDCNRLARGQVNSWRRCVFQAGLFGINVSPILFKDRKNIVIPLRQVTNSMVVFLQSSWIYVRSRTQKYTIK